MNEEIVQKDSMVQELLFVSLAIFNNGHLYFQNLDAFNFRSVCLKTSWCEPLKYQLRSCKGHSSNENALKQRSLVHKQDKPFFKDLYVYSF